MTTKTPIAPVMRSAMLSALVQQSIIMVLAGMILDGGGVFQSCFYALTAFWVGIGIILRRRASEPTRVDLVIVRGGSIVLCVLSFFLTHEIWHMRGY